MKQYFIQWIWLISIISSSTLNAKEVPPIPLANKYQQDIQIEQYWVSEKLDGVRAYWDGKQLISKNGNPFSTPKWFTEGFPSQKLDGELWIARNQFEKLISTINQEPINHQQWKNVRYMVFDLPLKNIPFKQRLTEIRSIVDSLQIPHLLMVEQYQLSGHEALMERLEQTINAGGEGLMLHKGSAYYQAGRSDNLLKVKKYQDAEATIIGHKAGKGKYTGLLGSLLVIDENGKIFSLGSGLSDQQRKNPPPIGTIVTYKFTGRTINGLPKFASFLRVRGEM